jgi:hypothetical protein
MVYMQATIELKAAGLRRFSDTLKIIIPIVESAGWHLVAAFTQSTGRLYTAVDLWRMPDLNCYANGRNALRLDSRWPEISATLADVVERETVVLGTPADWMPAGRMER